VRSASPPIVLVTHHVDEIPPASAISCLLRDGQVLTKGPIDAALTSESLSETFGLPLCLERRNGRFSAYAR
jgi:iron complex transport system ATP-binding protein